MDTKEIKNLIAIPSVALVLAACTSATIVMEVDDSLENNATVYELSYPDSLSDKISDKRMNITFGPYRVADADLSLKKVNIRAEYPASLVDIKNVEQRGDTTITTRISGGPTSIFGFSRPPGEYDATITESSRTMTYNFMINRGATWSAYCEHQSVKKNPPEGRSGNVEILSSNFGCQYKKPGSSEDVWLLVIDTQRKITLTREGESTALFAHSTGGKYATAKGKTSTSFNGTAGYTWSHIQDGVDTKVAAISVREERSRIWLSKENTEQVNHLLSMANTGLLIYSWEFYD